MGGRLCMRIPLLALAAAPSGALFASPLIPFGGPDESPYGGNNTWDTPLPSTNGVLQSITMSQDTPMRSEPTAEASNVSSSPDESPYGGNNTWDTPLPFTNGALQPITMSQDTPMRSEPAAEASMESASKPRASMDAWLSLDKLRPRLGGNPAEQTAIVTHAGKNQQEYIDMAIMLGLALKRYAPEFPRVALGIRGMIAENKELLQKAGWRVLVVEDILYREDSCETDGPCDKFKLRWQDSFEKLNVFRLPFRRVLYMDADTYVFNDRIRLLLNSTILDEASPGSIAMPPEPCGKVSKYGGVEYNSGVMLFTPDLKTFHRMMTLASKGKGDDVLDQNIVNRVYHRRQVAIDRHFDCIDPIGIAPGTQHKCRETHKCKTSEVVVSHFTGLFKPTKAFPPYLRLVQRPEVARATCENTNHGGCTKWAEYYCELFTHRKYLSPELQFSIQQIGGCCLGKNHNNPECSYETRFNTETDGCPNSMTFQTSATKQWWMRHFNITNITAEDIHDYRPIFQLEDEPSDPQVIYLFYLRSKGNWIIGPNYRKDLAVTYAHSDALCPNDANNWKMLVDRTNWLAHGATRLHPTPTACPASVSVGSGAKWPEDLPTFWQGVFDKAEIAPSTMHGLRPIYQLRSSRGSDPVYLYFLQAKTTWAIGPSYEAYDGYAHARADSYCPRDNLLWTIKASTTRTEQARLLIGESNSPDPLSRPIAAKAEEITEKDEDDAARSFEREQKLAAEVLGLEQQVKTALQRKTYEKIKPIGWKLAELGPKLEANRKQNVTAELKAWGDVLRQTSHKEHKVKRVDPSVRHSDAAMKRHTREEQYEPYTFDM